MTQPYDIRRYSRRGIPTGNRSLQQRQRPFPQIKEHLRIRRIVLKEYVEQQKPRPNTLGRPGVHYIPALKGEVLRPRINCRCSGSASQPNIRLIR